MVAQFAQSFCSVGWLGLAWPGLAQVTPRPLTWGFEMAAILFIQNHEQREFKKLQNT